jgi:hypothetical protein
MKYVGIDWQGGTSNDNGASIVPYKENVIPSSVRAIAKRAVPGVGAVQFWVGVTKQHGYCTALRLPGGTWAEPGRDSRIYPAWVDRSPAAKQPDGRSDGAR